MIKHVGRGNFGVRVEMVNDPTDVIIYWSKHKLGQNINFESFSMSKRYKVSKENK